MSLTLFMRVQLLPLRWTCPHGKTVIQCKWVYKIKTQFAGTIKQYKSSFIAKGFTLEYGIDYEEPL